MFDVSWEDPASETVAQHRQRKERPGSQNSSLRSGESSDSSRTQSTQRTQKPLGRVGKQQKAPLPNRSISLLKHRSISPAKKPIPILKTSTSIYGLNNIPALKESDADDTNYHFRDSVTETLQSAPLSNEISIANRSSWSSITDSTPKTYEIQTLAGDSFITRTTEVATSPQDCKNVLAGPVKEVHISAHVPYTDDDFTIQMDGEIFKFPRPPTTPTVKSTDGNSSPKAIRAPPTPSLPKLPEIWIPPVDWGCHSETPKRSSRSTRSTRKSGSRKTRSLANDLSASETEPTHLTRHIRRMEAASPKIMLERMREEWTEVADATIYKELEFEKQLWMLTALKFLNNKSGSNTDCTCAQNEPEMKAKAQPKLSKVLSLYENQATASASFFATFTPNAEIHHLSTSPLSPSSNHSIHPLIVPIPHHHLPYAPQLFTSISCLNLPALLASPSIPILLRECHRLLLPSGTLNLTIIDPAPVPTTLGPCLRAWLEKHLLINLEKNFRCTSPRRLIPDWLRDAQFAYGDEGGEGVAMITFWAVNNGVGDIAELTALVGRLLWKEIWGGFVEGERWWWDDEFVIQECEKLGTRWDCAIVEAVKRE